MKPFTLPSGVTGFTDDNGAFVCTGSQMGRRNILPEDNQASLKLRLVRLPFVDGAYDRWGAYWGCPANVYCAEGEDCRLFFRANSRDEAKRKVRETIPNARFYR